MANHKFEVSSQLMREDKKDDYMILVFVSPSLAASSMLTMISVRLLYFMTVSIILTCYFRIMAKDWYQAYALSLHQGPIEKFSQYGKKTASLDRARYAKRLYIYKHSQM